MVTDGDSAYCGEHWELYGIVKSINCTPKTTKTLYATTFFVLFICLFSNLYAWCGARIHDPKITSFRLLTRSQPDTPMQLYFNNLKRSGQISWVCNLWLPTQKGCVLGLMLCCCSVKTTIDILNLCFMSEVQENKGASRKQGRWPQVSQSFPTLFAYSIWMPPDCKISDRLKAKCKHLTLALGKVVGMGGTTAPEATYSVPTRTCLDSEGKQIALLQITRLTKNPITSFLIHHYTEPNDIEIKRKRGKSIILFPLVIQISGEMTRSMWYKWIQRIENERKFPTQFCEETSVITLILNPNKQPTNNNNPPTHTHIKKIILWVYLLFERGYKHLNKT